MKPALLVEDMTYRWPGAKGFELAVDRVEIAQFESVLLLGGSGSGKSTLLSLICGIIQADKGKICVNSTDVGQLAAARRDRFRADNIGVIFQQFNLLPNVTPLDNVLLPLHFAPARKARLSQPPRETALSLLDQLGLPRDAMTSDTASQLSVGQQQRVAVARALIGQPPLIIADEPTSALDEASQTLFLDLLFKQVGAAGSTLLMVSHDARLGEHFDRQISLETISTTNRKGNA